MIPKIIHYCWFGGGQLPSYAVRYIESWRRYFLGYEIMEWSENNYDVRKIPYISEAYDAKKYAFVSDYARFDVLYQCGGIYFDVDVEAIKPFGNILDDTGFMGTESLGAVATGLGIGCEAGMGVVKEILDDYAEDTFLHNDGICEYNTKTVVQRVTEILVKNGFDAKSREIQKIAGFTIYPPEYFAPEDPITYITRITDKSVSIHHYWIGKEKDRVMWGTGVVLRKKYFRKYLFGLLGENIFTLSALKVYSILSSFKRFIARFFGKGAIVTLKYYYNIIMHRKNQTQRDN
jgi:hypothetical protein